MKPINFFKKIKTAITTLYTSGTAVSYVAIATTTIIVLTVGIFASIAIISNVTSADEETTATHKRTSSFYSSVAETTTEQITTTAPETIETTSEEIETESETETETETTTVIETTTSPETIPIEDLDIGKPEDDSEEFIDKGALEEEFEPETTEAPTEPPTEAPTEAPTQNPTESTTEITTEAPTEPPTEAPVSEYACVVKGIDISKWNSQGKTAIDWQKVKESGVQFAIIRAGHRSTANTSMFEDPYFKEHIEGALSAGLQVGVYFYSQAITEDEALEEASYLLSIIEGYKLTYPVCFDWEPVSGSRAGNAKLSKAQATAIAKKFLSTIEGYGYEAMLYSYHSAIMNYFDTDALSEYKTWMAWYYAKYKNTGVQYAIGDELPDTKYPYQMWQYSSTGTVPGIDGQVDLNVAFFSYTGSGVPNSAIVLNLPHTSYTTNINVPIDYKAGVKAFNTAGLDVSSDITTTIKDSDDNLVSYDNVFKTPGKYTITYTIKDFTGVSKEAIASLTVRANPVITYTSDTLTLNSKKTYDDLLSVLNDNLVSATDYENKSLDLSNVTIDGLDKCYNKNTKKLIPGTYEITYNITDNSELAGSSTITVVVEEYKEPTTTPPESSTSKPNDETSNETTTTSPESSDDETSTDDTSSETTTTSPESSSDESSDNETSDDETSDDETSDDETTSSETSSSENPDEETSSIHDSEEETSSNEASNTSLPSSSSSNDESNETTSTSDEISSNQ